MQNSANVAPCGNHCPNHRLSQAYPGPQTDCIEECWKDLSKDQRTSPVLCYITAIQKTVIENSESKQHKERLALCTGLGTLAAGCGS